MMSTYEKMGRAELERELSVVQRAFADVKKKGLKLDMSRGKPGRAQLDLASGILTALRSPEDCQIDGLDARNYGEMMGLPACRKLFAEILGVRPEQVFAAGNSSLNLMYDTVAKAYTHGLLHSERPWSREEKVKFLCPAPGYDRHFKLSQSFGMELVTIAMTPVGPDMDAVEEAVKDPAVKGIWCVPKYANPTGIIYTGETVSRLARLKPAAPDFLLMWDNAYCIHEFDGDFVPFPDILSLCAEAGRPDMPFEFASTSKITLPGAGVAVFACSEANMDHMKKLMSFQLISYDKINQLRHVRYLQDKAHTLALMKQHAAIMKPKFDAVVDALERELAPRGLGRWERPKGGYFISYDALPGTAKRTLALCKEAGVVMTAAGATFPYGVDPHDSNIRIAPSLPPVEELEAAIGVFCICARLAALEHLLACM